MKRIWIYVFSKELPTIRLDEVKADCFLFVKEWQAHGITLNANYEVRHNRFLIISVDEQLYAASGCSIDKQIQFIKSLEQKYSIELLNRLLVAYKSNDNVQVVSSNELKRLIEVGSINGETLIFDNTITNYNELDTIWLKPLKNTWLKKHLLKEPI